jgi:hypothetical protein
VILPTFRNPSKAPKSYQGFDKSPCPLILYDDHWCNCKQQPHIANYVETSLLMLVCQYFSPKSSKVEGLRIFHCLRILWRFKNLQHFKILRRFKNLQGFEISLQRLPNLTKLYKLYQGFGILPRFLNLN